MTHGEIAQALLRLIREDANHPPEEQVRDLIQAGVIDKHGRVLIGSRDMIEQTQNTRQLNCPGKAPRPRKVRKSKRT